MQSIKIYLASRYSRRDEMRLYRAVLTLRGYEVTSRWLDETAECMEVGTESDHARVASVDVTDVERADHIIVFTPGGRNGGLFVELGIAITRNLGVHVVGPQHNVFSWLPGVQRYATWQQMLEQFPDRCQTRIAS